MSNKKLAGVCSGVARYLDIDVTLVRVLFIVGVLFKCATVLLYLILWAAMSRDDERRMAAAAV